MMGADLYSSPQITSPSPKIYRLASVLKSHKSGVSGGLKKLIFVLD